MENVNFTNFDWSRALRQNLGRNTLTQGSRTKVYVGGPDSFIEQAMRGDKPAITTPILAKRPDDEGNVDFIVRGYGRVTSIQEWMRHTPEQRMIAGLIAVSLGGKLKESDKSSNVVKTEKKTDEGLKIEETKRETAFQPTLTIAPEILAAIPAEGEPFWHEVAKLPIFAAGARSEEHTSELQSRENLVCR